MPIPVRTVAGDYYFHVYDYDDSQPWTPSPQQPTRNNERFYSMVQDLNGLYGEGLTRQVPNIQVNTAGAATEGGRRTRVLSFGNAGNVAGRPVVLITGGVHALEWMGAEMAYLLAEYLILNYHAVPANQNQRTIKELVDSRDIHIIPMANPDGSWYTVFTAGAAARLWRKNRRVLPTTAVGWTAVLAPGGNPNAPFTGVVAPPMPALAQYRVPNFDPAHDIPPGTPVRQLRNLANNEVGVDLNRNLATQAFGYDSAPVYRSYDPTYKTYFGISAGGETESANLQQFAAGLGNLAASIDYHAFGQLILYPGEAASQNMAGTDYKKLGETLHALIRSQAAQDYRLGTPLQLLGYEGTGSVADYLAQQNQSRAFSVEVDPTNNPPPNPVDDGFRPPRTDILQMFRKNIRGALAALAAPIPATNWYGRIGRRWDIEASAATYLGWNGVYNRGNLLP